MELSLQGKKALITGAGAGIGLACAQAFVRAGQMSRSVMSIRPV